MPLEVIFSRLNGIVFIFCCRISSWTLLLIDWDGYFMSQITFLFPWLDLFSIVIFFPPRGGIETIWNNWVPNNSIFLSGGYTCRVYPPKRDFCMEGL